MRRICQCRLSGRAHYARRCPQCGLYRTGHLGGWQPTRQDWEQWRALAREWQGARRKTARRLLEIIARECAREVPAPPRAIRPRNWESLSPAQRSQWYERASYWEGKARDSIWGAIMAPFELFDELVRLPAQRRYQRAARRLLAEYARKVQAAGWILPNWCLKIVEEPPPPPSGPA